MPMLHLYRIEYAYLWTIAIAASPRYSIETKIALSTAVPIHKVETINMHIQTIKNAIHSL